MSPLLVGVSVTLAVLIGLGLKRVWDGPTVFDRLVAVALVAVNGVVTIAVLGFASGRPVLFLDIALGFAMLAFLLPVTLARYFERHERDEEGEA